MQDIDHLAVVTMTPPRQEGRLLNLPEELLVAILLRLDVKELLVCKTLCKDILLTIKDSLELQYRLELFAEGMTDGPPTALTVSDRYQQLLDKRRRWRELKWATVSRVPAPGLCQAYELVGGVLATSRATDERGSRHLCLTWLPTPTTPAETIEREDIGFMMRDFAIDPSQDLIAFIHANHEHTAGPGFYLKVDLRTMGANKLHPKASVPELAVPVAADIRMMVIQIVDDVVGVFYWAHDPGLVIWNWESGQLLVNVTSPTLPRGTFDFSFLSSRAYILTSTARDGIISIHSFPGALPAGTESPPQPVDVACLALPTTKPGHMLQRFATHCPPFVRYPIPGKPFETSRDTFLHVMTLDYGPREKFHLCVLNRFLLSLIPRFELEAPVTPLPWDQWGITNSRLLHGSHPFEWLRYVHGSRFILRPLRPTMQSERTMKILIGFDFNVHPTREDDPVPPSGNYSIFPPQPIGVDEESPFDAAVVSTLPCAFMRRIVMDMPPYTGFFIDDERIIGMMTAEESQIVNLSVYMF